MASNIETELKFTLSQSEFDKLVTSFKLLKIKRQRNIFFDTVQQDLARARWALRLRDEDGHFFLTAKGPGESHDGMVERIEIEVAIEAGHADALIQGRSAALHGLAPWQAVQDFIGARSVHVVLTFENQRRVFLWKNWKLEVDEAHCAGQRLLELEIECEVREKKSLLQDVRQLFASLGIEPRASTHSKLAWAMQCTAQGSEGKKRST